VKVFKAEGFEAAGPKAASLAVRCFREAAGFGKPARFGEVACFDEMMCFRALDFDVLPCLGELLKKSDSHPASLASIGRSSKAAIAAAMVRRLDPPPQPTRK